MDKAYHSYTLEELAADPDFRQWVLAPTADHQARWQDFLSRYPEKESLIKEAEALVLGVKNHFDQGTTHPEKLNQYYADVMRRADQPSTASPSWVQVSVFSYQKFAIAASFLLLLGLAGWFWLFPQNNLMTYTTAYGEWETLMLPDGSTVKLNANSELSLMKNWKEGADRTVWLSGEAFFEVEKKTATEAKFTVIANGVAVEVLGTAFNVNSRSDKTEVFLQEGKIRLEAGKEEMLMLPGELIAYSLEKQKIVEKREGVNDIHSSWKDGILIMEEKAVHEIFDRIAEIYGIEFQVQDTSLLETQTTIRVPMDKLEITIPILEKTLGTNIDKTGNRLVVH